MPTSAADIFRMMRDSPIAPWAIFNQLQNQPQGNYEPNVVYQMRTVNIPTGVQGPNGVFPNDLGLKDAISVPALQQQQQKQQQQQQKAADVFPTSYKDAAYSAADQNAARITGVPVDLLNRVRMFGERSNANQTSSAGAKTPYQITPDTRAGIIKNYGIDPWANPQNAALGAAYVLWEQAGRPSPKAWNDQRKVKAVGGYFGGAAGAANPFGELSDGGTTVGEYTQRVLGNDTKLPFPALNPYDPQYDKAAMNELNMAQAAAKQPSHYSIAGPGPAPELPKPEAIPTTDFSKADAALQAMKPIEMTAKEELKRERDGFFKGIGQAMMNMPANEGLGTFFMRLGGAALSGREAARDDIRREQDKFDDKMSRFQAAVYQNDLVKAQTLHNEMTQQVKQNNDYAMANWQVKYDQWKGAGGSVDISGTNAVLTRKDANGNITADVLPIAGAVDAAFALRKADLFSSIGGRQFAGNQQITAMTNSLSAQAALQAMSSGPSKESDAAVAAAPAMYSTFLVTHGGVADVIGADGLKSLEQNIQKQLMQAQIVPGSKEYVDRHDTIMANELTKLAVASPDIMRKMMQAGSAMPSFKAAEALDASKTSTRTDARGRTTTTTSAPAAADMFSSDDFNNQLASHGYSRY
jgi:hypothetical protein